MKALATLVIGLASVVSAAERIKVNSPDGRLIVSVSDEGGRAAYEVSYDGATVLEKSSLGFMADCGNFTEGLAIKSVRRIRTMSEARRCLRAKIAISRPSEERSKRWNSRRMTGSGES